MRMGWDVRYLSHGLLGGVHTYIENLLPELIDLAQGHEVFLYPDRKRPFEISPLPPHVTLRFLPYRNAFSSVWNDFFMGRTLAKDRLDVSHFPANYGCRVPGARNVVTVHDELNLLPLIQIWRSQPRSIKPWVMMAYLHYWSRSCLRHMDLVITISEYSKRQIARYSSVDESKILAVPHGCPRDIQRVEDPAILKEVRDRLGLPEQFALADALKNPGVIARAWRLLPDEVKKRNQVVFFARSSVPQPVQDLVKSGHARLLTRPARQDFSALYSMASAFIFPSWIEGFGLPLLEAMVAGAPIIASDRGSIPEVVGDAAFLMDAEDEAKLAEHLTAVLGKTCPAQELRERGWARSRQFSWRRAGQMILNGYQGIL